MQVSIREPIRQEVRLPPFVEDSPREDAPLLVRRGDRSVAVEAEDEVLTDRRHRALQR